MAPSSLATTSTYARRRTSRSTPTAISLHRSATSGEIASRQAGASGAGRKRGPDRPVLAFGSGMIRAPDDQRGQAVRVVCGRRPGPSARATSRHLVKPASFEISSPETGILRGGARGAPEQSVAVQWKIAQGELASPTGFESDPPGE